MIAVFKVWVWRVINFFVDKTYSEENGYSFSKKCLRTKPLWTPFLSKYWKDFETFLFLNVLNFDNFLHWLCSTNRQMFYKITAESNLQEKKRNQSFILDLTWQIIKCKQICLPILYSVSGCPLHKSCIFVK